MQTQLRVAVRGGHPAQVKEMLAFSHFGIWTPPAPHLLAPEAPSPCPGVLREVGEEGREQ